MSKITRVDAAQPPKNFTHGEILRWRRVDGLLLAEVEYEPGPRQCTSCACFAASSRTTCAGYARQLRIELARRQLAGEVPLSAIATAAGFCDQSHFARLFKQYTGLTPAEYRLALQTR